MDSEPSPVLASTAIVRRISTRLSRPSVLRMHCRAACASGSRSPAPLQWSRSSCCVTSPPPRSLFPFKTSFMCGSRYELESPAQAAGALHLALPPMIREQGERLMHRRSFLVYSLGAMAVAVVAGSTKRAIAATAPTGDTDATPTKTVEADGEMARLQPDEVSAQWRRWGWRRRRWGWRRRWQGPRFYRPWRWRRRYWRRRWAW
jgi:hypothetical protein